MKHFNTPKAAATTGILNTIEISYDPKTFRTDLLPKSVQDRIAAARQKGRDIVSIRWPTGKFALGRCWPDARVPGAKRIHIFYREPQHNAQLSKKGAKP